MQIAFVTAGFGAGGAEKIVNLIARHRASMGDTVLVIGLNAGSESSFFPYPPTVRLVGAARGGRATDGLAGLGRRMFAARRDIAAFRPDVIVSFLTKINVLARIASAGFGAPLIVSERNNFEAQPMHPAWSLASRLALRSATRIVMQTEAARSRLAPTARAKAVVIPNPVTLAPGLVAHPGPGNRLVAAGRLVEQKGFDLLIRAFAMAAREIPEARLTIFGEGPLRGTLETLARSLDVAGRVSLPGISRSPSDWISAGDAFVLSSRYEGFPNVLLEALAARLPVVAVDCPWGPSEIIEHDRNGLLVHPGSVDALADAIRRILTDPALRVRLSAGAATTDARFGEASVLAAWDATFAAAVGGATRPVLQPAGTAAG